MPNKKITGDRRFRTLPLAAIACLSIGFSLLLPASSRPAGKKPPGNPFHVLLITIDTLRADRLSCYGSDRVETRTIDGLAGKGVLFTRAFAHTPTTLPSHTNILLGTTPLVHGVHDNANFIVDKKFPNLATHLKSYGYATGAFVGAFPLDSRFGLTQGFDVYDDNYGTPASQEFTFVERKAEVVVEQALAWLNERRQNQKWFLWIHCFDPHQRYLPPEPFLSQYRDRPYDGEIAYVDFALKKLFAYLGERDLARNTLIVFTGDHGESLGEHGESTHGYFAYNATIRIPLLIAFPGVRQGRVDQNVAHIDIFPTVCDVLGIEKPGFLQGVSLLPAINGKKLPGRRIYFESLYPYFSRGWAPLQGYIEGKEKFIETPNPEVYDLEADFD
ncbi:MAG: sulfatase, partial [Candidatus Aminicenantes bacterium]|nr:sulfatase [Candidatus Aminicenantes bacterium]